MNDEFNNLKEQGILYEMKEYLEKVSIPSTVMEASSDLPVNMLIAVTAENFSVNIIYLPLPEDQFQEIKLIQFYSLQIDAVSEEHKPELLNLLNRINDQNPFGSFFINEKAELGYKYIIPLSRFDIPKEMAFLETFNLFLSTISKFRDALIRVNNGETSAADALIDT